MYFLGSPRIELEGVPFKSDRRKAIALLAYLAVTDESHTRDKLATLLWPDSDQARAYAYLRRTLWELKKSLGEAWLDIDRKQIAIKQSPEVWMDIAAFRRGLSAFPSDDTSDECLQSLEQAVSLYRDDFLAGFTLRDSPNFDEWQFFQTERSRSELVSALERLVLGYASRDESETAADHARRWIALDPLHEPAHQQLMWLYAKMGQRAAALRQYEICAQIMEDEIGVPPQPETRALHDQIRSGTLEFGEGSKLQGLMEPAEATARIPPTTALNNIPSPPTPFVGRRQELYEIGRLLDDPACRLITLVGPGGMGKTRLAIQAAAEKRADFADGVCFIPLVSLRSAEHIVPALAAALNFSFYKDEKGDEPRQQLLDYLRPRNLLLVMDNYERLLDGGGTFLPVDILATSPGTKILATSRARLNVQGETLFSVTGMKTPEEEIVEKLESAKQLEPYTAIQLFIQCALRIRPEFETSIEHLVDIIHICQLVNGVPLGIELAAAWMGVLSPEEIAAEIEQSLDFLEVELADVPDRQRSIRAVFTSSWNLLTDEEQIVFKKLSVFHGGFAREAAQEVAGTSLKMLKALVDKSLLQIDLSGRYDVHELLRQYALEKLKTDPRVLKPVRHQHSTYYASFVSGRGEVMKGPEQKDAFDAVEIEIENIRAAWLWAAEQGQFDKVAETLDALTSYFTTRALPREFYPLLEMAVETMRPVSSAPNDQLILVKLQILQAWFLAMYNHESKEIKDYTERALGRVRELHAEGNIGLAFSYLGALYMWHIERIPGVQLQQEAVGMLRESGDKWALTIALNELGSSLSVVGEHEQAKQILVESITICRQTGDRLNLARGLLEMGSIASEEQAYDEVIRICEECREIFDAVGDHGRTAFTLNLLGENSLRTGDYKEAIESFQMAHEIFTGIGNRVWAGLMLSWKGLAALRLGDINYSRKIQQGCLSHFQEIGYENGLAWSLWEMGETYRVEGKYLEARQWYRQSRNLYQDRRDLFLDHRGKGDIALAEGDFEEAQEQFEECLVFAREGYRFWNVAYAMIGQGRAAVGLGEYESARRFFHSALLEAQKAGGRGLNLIALTGVAKLLVATDEVERAAEIAAHVVKHHASWQETKGQAKEVLAEAVAKMADDIGQQAIERGQTRILEPWIAEIVELLEQDHPE